MTWYRRWKARRRKLWQCERCGRDLTRTQKTDLTAVWHTEDGPGAITATYCKRHGRMAKETQERTP